VRERSHATPLALGNYTKETLSDAILQERGWEFFYEGKRRADLIRFNKYDVIVNAYLTRIGQPAVIEMPKNRYFPYPQNQEPLIQIWITPEDNFLNRRICRLCLHILLYLIFFS
jgi:hypothetical protein